MGNQRLVLNRHVMTPSIGIGVFSRPREYDETPRRKPNDGKENPFLDQLLLKGEWLGPEFRDRPILGPVREQVAEEVQAPLAAIGVKDFAGVLASLEIAHVLDGGRDEEIRVHEGFRLCWVLDGSDAPDARIVSERGRLLPVTE